MSSDFWWWGKTRQKGPSTSCTQESQPRTTQPDLSLVPVFFRTRLRRFFAVVLLDFVRDDSFLRGGSPTVVDARGANRILF